ncbi:MAG: copper amine oxidase N-terminal domain-containing protein, partial [Clostridia bacterium]|nr:copper amine oxidase N-terminal domain-containing protein [Clostridia bacterium]
MRDDDGTGYACNLGNYGVIYNYNIEITNNGNKRRYILYRLATSSNNLVWVKDANENPINGRILAKGRKTARIADDMACLTVPAQTTSKYTVCVLLAANYSGGMENAFVLADSRKPIETYETERGGIEKDGAFDGREYYSWDGAGLSLSGDRILWRHVELPKEVRDGIAGNLSEYRLQWTGSGYTLRPTLYDAGSFGFIDYMYRDMYLLDEDFALIGKQTFGGYPSGYACANGVHYVEISGTVFRSTSDFKWWDVTDMTLPCWNYGKFSAVSDGGAIRLSSDGVDFYEVDYRGFKPKYIDANGGFYYFADGRVLSLSLDGLNWRHLVFNERVKAFEAVGGMIVVNGSEARPMPGFDDNFAVRIDDKYISTEPAAIIKDGSPYIPIRAVCELLGYEVIWQDGAVTIKRGARTVNISDITMIGASAYAPLDMLSSDLGHNVQYDAKKREAVVQRGETNK